MKVFGLVCTLAISLSVFGQRQSGQLYLEGTVLGYHYEPKGFFKKEQVEIQGSLSRVKLSCINTGGSEIASTFTDNGGAFSLYLPLNQKITLTYNKSGYGNSSIEIDTRTVPDDMFQTGLLLENVELILNENQTEFPIDNGRVFARVVYGSSNVFSVQAVEFEKKDRLFKEIENSTPLNLLTRSVKKNKDKNLGPIEAESVEEETVNQQSSSPKLPKNNNSIDAESTEQTSVLQKKLDILRSAKFGDVEKWKNLTISDIDERATEITAAWDQLEKDRLVAVTDEDFIIIEAREELLRSAERELEAAKAYIEEQDDKIAAQRNFMIAMVIMLILLGGFVSYLIRSIREKNRLNTELAKKNKKISSSINYAERIQKSVLLRDDEIKAIVPESFVFFQPLDVVSGDFYWFSEVSGKIIVAAVDCTGHGVPGAFMSLIGNTLMNQIINEKKIIQPGKILKQLHEGIVKSLNQEEDINASQDGMDMSICSIDKTTGELIFAGAVNPIFVVEKGEFKEVSGDLRGVGGILSKRKREVSYTEHHLKFEKGTNIYLFSDGYMDQFGGSNNEKFNLPRFRELLLRVQHDPVASQKEQIIKAWEDWKGSAKQVDDILVIGIQV